MTFKKKDIFWLYREDKRDSKNRRRYRKHEGRKKAYYVWIRGSNGDIESVVRFTTKDFKPEKVKLRGPDDLKETKEFAGILNGKKLDYPFLTKIENRILTMRSLGKSRSKIARALSGGRIRRSYTAASIKYQLNKARKKIRQHEGRLQMANISANLEKEIINEIDRIAKDKGKTRTRVIYEACVDYCDQHATPNTWKTEHFEIDFNCFNKLRRQLMDLENAGITEIG